MKIFNNIKLYFSFFAMTVLIFISPIAYAQTVANKVDTNNAGTATKVAPGEFLPISVRLSNFGGNSRVDVLVSYGIFSDTGDKIYGSDETVAVETTANYVKKIQIPSGTQGGVYTAKTSITYRGQVVPATTSFSFTVEGKILGIFQNDFILYAGIIIIAGVLLVFFGRSLIKRRRAVRLSPFDYSDIPRDRRTFYEILSDTILGMRERVGDDALNIASNIEGLKIDKETGRVLALSASPSKIIATLVAKYEELLGKKVSFALRPSETLEKSI